MSATGNLLELTTIGTDIPYKELRRGQFFRLCGQERILFKCGTKAISLINGSEHSMDQQTMIVPLPIGTVIKITLGEQT